mgnify:CR=1 FL=1
MKKDSFIITAEGYLKLEEELNNVYKSLFSFFRTNLPSDESIIVTFFILVIR